MTTGIQWTDETWNPVVGCNQVSFGCDLCYAKSLHDKRHRAFLDGKKVAPQYAQPFEVVQLKPERLREPIGWRRPRRVFVNSVSDLFHASVPDEFLDRVFAVMAFASRHTFQILSKRAGRMRSYIDGLADRSGSGRGFARLDAAGRDMGLALSFEGIPLVSWPIPNVWLGVSVENRAALSRIHALRGTAAAVRFVSFEPLLEAVAPDLTGIDWAIVGGESGRGAREFDLAWARDLVAQCANANVACFVKQLGANPVDPWSDTGALVYDREPARPKFRDSHGGDITEWPDDLKVREFPSAVLVVAETKEER
jgi:protein gp37